MSEAAKLARWIRGAIPEVSEPMTHLKLQKLAFYCYGAALAFRLDGEVGVGIAFEAWKNGPVCRDIWHEYKTYGGTPIPNPTTPTGGYSSQTEAVLKDVLTVYGVMDAWSLRQESHLEKPWINAWEAQDHAIPREELRAYFAAKFNLGNVRYPAYLLGEWNFAIDRVPVHGTHRTLHDLAESVRRALTS